MKDKEGRTLVNAHVLGFLRRINKLLFHGIKPVFVFDGGAPALKRSTIARPPFPPAAPPRLRALPNEALSCYH